MRHALRSLLRSPGYVATVLATLAIAVGANAAMFALVREVLLRPLPFREPDRLVRLWALAPDGSTSSVSPPVWDALRARTDVFETVAGSRDQQFNLTGMGEPETLLGYRLSAEYLPMLGVRPLHGRLFRPDEDRPGSDRVVVLTHRLWLRRFAGDPAVVGRTLTLSGDIYTIIGVMPAGVVQPPGIEIWAPLALAEGQRDDASRRFLRVVARLRPGADVADARRAVNEVAARLQQERPELLRGHGFLVRTLPEERHRDARAPVLALAGAVGFVLLGCCANLAGLALARGVARRHDAAVRVALGAGRAQLLRDSLAEWLLLAAGGALLGLAVAGWLARALPGLFPATISNLDLPKLDALPIDGPIVAFALLAAVVVSAVAAAVGAAQALRTETGTALKGAGRTLAAGGGRTLRRIVGVEVALALVLLVGAGLLVRAFQHLQSGGLGFETERVLTARLILPEHRYQDPQRTLALHDGVLERLRALPGVEAAGSVAYLPLSGWGAGVTFRFEGQPPARPGHENEADLQWIDHGYLAATRIPLLAGRAFEERDRGTAPAVALVNASFVRRFLGGTPEAAIGRSVLFGGEPADGEPAEPAREIVGVIGDVRHLGFEEPAPASIYVPFAQEPTPIICLAVRTRGEPAALAPALREAVWALDPEQPVSYLMPYQELARESLTLRRLSALIAAFFAAVALGLAALGTYGVVAQAVANGRREIGVRLALGASTREVVRAVLSQALTASALGAALGLAAAIGLARLMRGLLFGIAPLDPVALLAATGSLLAVAGAAAWLPARQAARVDPAVVLRQD